MQQCVEKYLKAFLVSHGREVPRTHNLAVVVQACIEIDSDFTALREEGIDGMTDYAVAYRYPDDFYMPTVEECERAQAKALRIRDFVTRRLAGEDA